MNYIKTFNLLLLLNFLFLPGLRAQYSYVIAGDTAGLEYHTPPDSADTLFTCYYCTDYIYYDIDEDGTPDYWIVLRGYGSGTTPYTTATLEGFAGNLIGRKIAWMDWQAGDTIFDLTDTTSLWINAINLYDSDIGCDTANQTWSSPIDVTHDSNWVGLRFLSGGEYILGWMQLGLDTFACLGPGLVTYSNVIVIGYASGFSYVNVEDADESITLSCYPNPVKEKLHLNVSHHNKATTWRLWDAHGKQLLSGVSDGNDEIDVSGLPAGIYLLQAVIDDRVKNIKVVKH